MTCAEKSPNRTCGWEVPASCGPSYSMVTSPPGNAALGNTFLMVISLTWFSAESVMNQCKRDYRIEPGSNIVVPLVRGDMDVAAGGTVTYIEGNKVYAFGHPLFNLGFAELPMHKGRAITVFPSLQSSFKVLETTEPVGTIRQDRGSGIFGILGEKAKMIPINVRLATSRGVKKTLKYEIARDRFLTPFLVNFTVFNSIISSERGLGVSTVELKGKINIKGEQPVEIENRFSSESNSPVIASLSIARKAASPSSRKISGIIRPVISSM